MLKIVCVCVFDVYLVSVECVCIVFGQDTVLDAYLPVHLSIYPQTKSFLQGGQIHTVNSTISEREQTREYNINIYSVNQGFYNIQIYSFNQRLYNICTCLFFQPEMI